MQLDPEQISKYRSHVARCLFFSRDRADMTFAVNELCRRMTDPTQHSCAKLKRLVRYLKGERQWIMNSEVTVFSDSDWAGGQRIEELVKRRGCARGTTPFGSVYKESRKSIARSSAETELYAAAWGTSEAKEVQSMMCDLGFAVKPVLIIDAKSNRAQSTLTWNRFVAAKMKSNRTGLESAVSRARTILRTLGRRRSATESSESTRYLWCTWMFKRSHGAVGWQIRASRPVQSRSAQNVIGINWWPDSSIGSEGSQVSLRATNRDVSPSCVPTPADCHR